MKVYDRNLTGAGAAETGKAQETAKADTGASRSSSRSGVGGGDRVELSGTLERLSRALDESGSQRAQRVESLAALYAAGRYRADPSAVSNAMVSEALVSGE